MFHKTLNKVMIRYECMNYHLKPISFPHKITSYWQTPEITGWNHIDFLFKLDIVIKLTFQQILKTRHHMQLLYKTTVPVTKQHRSEKQTIPLSATTL